MVVFVDDREIEHVALAQSWDEYKIMLPGDVVSQDEITALAFVHAVATAPFDATGGSGSDTRALTAAYDWSCFEEVLSLD